MKKIALIVAVAVFFVLNVGYYNIAHEHSPDTTVFFIKKSLTFRVKFTNIFTVSWGADPAFTEDDMQAMVDYCKYRFGIDVTLDNSSTMERCSGR
jgi:hypothetical protein